MAKDDFSIQVGFRPWALYLPGFLQEWIAAKHRRRIDREDRMLNESSLRSMSKRELEDALHLRGQPFLSKVVRSKEDFVAKIPISLPLNGREHDYLPEVKVADLSAAMETYLRTRNRT